MIERPTNPNTSEALEVEDSSCASVTAWFAVAAELPKVSQTYSYSTSSALSLATHRQASARHVEVTGCRNARFGQPSGLPVHAGDSCTRDKPTEQPVIRGSVDGLFGSVTVGVGERASPLCRSPCRPSLGSSGGHRTAAPALLSTRPRRCSGRKSGCKVRPSTGSRWSRRQRCRTAQSRPRRSALCPKSPMVPRLPAARLGTLRRLLHSSH